jgi:hypothetical protein
MTINRIVKLQKRKSDYIVSIPAMAHQELKETEYMKCSVDEDGIHYTKLEMN